MVEMLCLGPSCPSRVMITMFKGWEHPYAINFRHFRGIAKIGQLSTQSSIPPHLSILRKQRYIQVEDYTNNKSKIMFNSKIKLKRISCPRLILGECLERVETILSCETHHLWLPKEPRGQAESLESCSWSCCGCLHSGEQTWVSLCGSLETQEIANILTLVLVITEWFDVHSYSTW